MNDDPQLKIVTDDIRETLRKKLEAAKKYPDGVVSIYWIQAELILKLIDYLEAKAHVSPEAQDAPEQGP